MPSFAAPARGRRGGWGTARGSGRSPFPLDGSRAGVVADGRKGQAEGGASPRNPGTTWRTIPSRPNDRRDPGDRRQGRTRLGLGAMRGFLGRSA
jgi:hypothetical protein